MKRYKHRLINAILTISFSLFSYNVQAAYYACHNEKRDGTILFSWDKSELRVEKNTFLYKSFNSPLYSEQLNTKTKSGSYNIRKSKNMITLTYVGLTAKAKVKHPSGQLTPDSPKIQNITNLQKAVRYHAVFFSLTKYTFDLKKKSLTLSLQDLYPPKEVTKQKFKQNRGKIKISHTGKATKREIDTVFPDTKHINTYLYPHCEEEGVIKNWLRYFYNIFSYVW